MRARNIKPGFFKNEDLADVEPIDRLFFIGMWCAADREGRLIDRPKRIKMDVMPCDNYDAEAGVQRLTDCGFLDRYTANGINVIQIVNFLKHQSPHSLEKDSILPDKNGCLTVHERKNGRVCSDKKQFIGTIDDDKEQLENGLETENTGLYNSLDVPDSLDSKAKSKAKAFVAPKARPSKKPPDDFSITPEMREWARTKAPHVNIDLETEAFLDHTFAHGKTDWVGTWRNWMRRSSRDKPRPPDRRPSIGLADQVMQNHLQNQQRSLECLP